MACIEAIIVDDELMAIENMGRLLEPYDFVEIVGTAMNVDDAFKLILDKKPNLIFLDVNLPRRDGFELIHDMKIYNIVCDVIFVTAFDKYAISALRHCAIDYLLKPVISEELETALNLVRAKNRGSFENKINQLLDRVNVKKLQFNYRTGHILVDPFDILLCEASGNYTKIVFLDGNYELVTTQLSEIEGKINIKSMIRLSRTYLINTDYISQLDRKSKILSLSKNGFTYDIKVPRNKLKMVVNL